MDEYIVTAIIADQEDSWRESFSMRFVSRKEAEALAKSKVENIVSVFNSSLRPNELPRHLVSIESIKAKWEV